MAPERSEGSHLLFLSLAKKLYKKMQSTDGGNMTWILYIDEHNEYPSRLKGERVLTKLPIIYLWTKEPEKWFNFKNFLYYNKETEYLYFKIKPEYIDKWKEIISRPIPFDHDDNLLDIDVPHDYEKLQSYL